MSTSDKKRGERTLLTETHNLSPSSKSFDEAIAESKTVRAQALQNAKKAVEDAFNMRGEIISTPSETDAAVKKFLTNENPELLWISHEGSLLLSAMIGVSDEGKTIVTLNELPDTEKELIRNVLERLSGSSWSLTKGFEVKFDKYKNFEVSTTNTNTWEKIVFSLGNRVSSVPPDEARSLNNVKVERKGKEILIGDRIKLERDRIQNLVQPEQTSNGQTPRPGFQPRQKVAGRNAYEIRADVLEMALDWAKHSNKSSITEEDVVAIAEAFYGFVEHR